MLSKCQFVISIFIRNRHNLGSFEIREYFSCSGSKFSCPSLCSSNCARRIHISNTKNLKEHDQNENTRDARDDYEMIFPVTESYFGQVLTHMRNNFFVDEPTQKMIGKNARGEPIPILEKTFLEALGESLSVMYIHVPTNQIAAITINGIFTPSDVITDTDVHINDEEIRMIYSLFANIHRCLNLFEKYGVNKIFDIKAVSVDENHRKRGLAKAVIEKSLEIAEACGCKVIKTEGTSQFTQIAFAKSGFKTEWERNYTAFICENGDPVFQPFDPHRNLKIMTKVLNKDHDWWSLLRGSLVPLGMSFTILAIFQYFNYKLKVD